jgi:hypothetical protein
MRSCDIRQHYCMPIEETFDFVVRQVPQWVITFIDKGSSCVNVDKITCKKVVSHSQIIIRQRSFLFKNRKKESDVGMGSPAFAST